MDDLFQLFERASQTTPNQQEIRKHTNSVKQISDWESLQAANAPQHLKAKLDARQVRKGDPIGLERLLGKNNLVDINFLQKGLETASTVCRIVFARGEQLTPLGTGFLVGKRLLITNNHVIKTPGDTRSLLAQFQFEADLEGNIPNGTTFRFDPAHFYLTDKQLDYTLVGLEPIATNDPESHLDKFRYNELKPIKDKIIQGEAISIIQHPNGQPKKIAMRDSQISDLGYLPEIYYTTDTLRGSSGGLVANDEWEVIALHSGSVPETEEINGEKKIVLRKGKGYYRDRSDLEFVNWIANKGTFIDAILDDVAGKTVQDSMKTVKDQLLTHYHQDLDEGGYQLPV